MNSTRSSGSGRRRVGVAGLWHETNTYSARPTGIEAFEAFELLAGDAVVARHRGTRTVVAGMLAAQPFETVPVWTAGAWPSGRLRAGTLSTLLESLAQSLERAGTLDGLLLNLHGAMVAEQTDDVEAETLRVVRDIVGDVPIAAVLDLHGNPSAELAALLDAAVAYDTYPHIDMYERGREAANLMQAMLSGERLHTVIGKVPLLTTPLAQATDASPMRALLELARRSRTGGIERISVLPGFPYSDVERAGFSVLVTCRPGAEDAAARIAGEISAAAEARRDDFVVRRPGPGEAVARALAASRRPVVLVDVADNVGGGAPGDGTAILEQLLEQGAQGAVVTLADPDAVARAVAAGVGSGLDMALGARVDGKHGAPVHASVRVERVGDGRYRSSGSYMTGRDFEMGRTAVVRAGGVTLVLTERAVPPFHVEQLESVGVEPRDAAIIVVKGAIAWRAAYGAIAREVIEVDTPGICPLDPAVLERATRPIRV
jgi:microcystin degradation protein MlrC